MSTESVFVLVVSVVIRFVYPFVCSSGVSRNSSQKGCRLFSLLIRIFGVDTVRCKDLLLLYSFETSLRMIM